MGNSLFLPDSDVDSTIFSCEIIGTNIIHANYILTAGGIISSICYLYIFYLYFVVKAPALKRHPTTLAIYKCFFEFLFVQQYIWVSFLTKSDIYVNNYTFPSCRTTTLSAVFAFLSQFSLIGGELFFAVISMDLRMSYINPFSSYKQYRTFYYFFVFGISTFSASILIWLGCEVYGPSSEGLIWIQNRYSGDQGATNYAKIFLFYIIMLIIYTYCIFVVYILKTKLQSGFLTKTLKLRESIMIRAQKYVLGYVVFWGVTLSTEFLSYFYGLYVSGSSGSSGYLNSFPSYLYCFRGVWTLAIILYTNWSELSVTKQNQQIELVVTEGLKLKPHLNAFLRSEILYCTTQGIMQAAKAFNNQKLSSFQKKNLKSVDKIKQNNDFSELSNLSLFNINMNFNENENSNNPLQDSNNDMNSSRESFMNIQTSQHQQIELLLSQAVDSDIIDYGLNNSVSAYSNIFNNRQAMINNKPINIIDEDRISEESDSTIKWRDTIDVEFTLSRSSTDTPEFHLGSTSRSLSTNNSRNPSTTSGNLSQVDIVAIKKSILLAWKNTGIRAINIINAIPEVIVFKDFCPKIFAEIREMCCIDSTEYANAFLETKKEIFSEGRSGAFMFFSFDMKYIVKTTQYDEIIGLQLILSKYRDYLAANPHSLMTKIIGAHSITMYGKIIYFIVQQNIFPASENLSERYDLKGSWVNRYTNAGKNLSLSERYKNKKSDDSSPLYQDNDLTERITLPPGVSDNLAAQIKKDIRFLRDCNLMDYSLIIGIIRRRFPVTTLDNENYGINIGKLAGTVEGPGTYFFGIIDVLQPWNWRKKLERFFKIYFLFKDGAGISAIEPDAYMERFYERVVLNTFEGLSSNEEIDDL